MPRQLLCFALLLAVAPATAPAQTTHRFTPTEGVPTFAARPPVLRVVPGDIVETETFSRPGDYYAQPGGRWPGEVGPFHIEGASPGDTLVVKILKLRLNRDHAVSAVNPGGISAVAGDSRTRMLNHPLPPRRYEWRLDRERNVGILELPGSAGRRIEIPLRPMLGRVAVAPAGEESWGGLWPGNFGGNMDAPDIREGVTVYLPVFHEGALFYFGDVHAAQGDGEIVGSGLETTADVTFQFDVIKGQRIGWPRIEDDTHLMVAGSVRPLVDAFRIAHVELIDWLVADYGFDRMDAYQVVSQAGTARVANVVDPNYTVVAKFPKALLPPKTGVAARQGASEPEDAFVPEPGYTLLFNGRDLTGWGFRRTSDADRESARRWQASSPDAALWPFVEEPVDFDGLPETPDGRFRAVGGRLVVTPAPEGRKIQQLWTTREFGDDFELRLEFRASPNADSGLYLRGPQLQVRDYRLAGPYRSLASYRPQDWNEIVVVVRGRTARVTCNGELIEEAFELPARGPIGVEGDRGQMEYRRIRIRPLAP